MNNFMSTRPGFYHNHEDIPGSTSTTAGMSSCTSSTSISSSFHHKNLPLYTTYHHHQEQPPEEPVDDSDDHMYTTRVPTATGEASTTTPGGGATSSSPAAPQPHVSVIEKEHMFDKVVTPSDVGKLNRLVIPKQHAEKYFPLDSSANEKGLLLNFEDRNGKPWRFRYSYWNSSQSYVMTKGWSRFVKEKKLDAGDIVSFQRGLGEVGKDRLFIDWRRRPDAPDLTHHSSLPSLSMPHQFSFQRSSIHPWNPLFLHPQTSREYSHLLQNPHHHQGYGYGGMSNSSNYGYNNSNVVNGNPCPPGSIVYLRSGAGSGGGGGGLYGSSPQQVGVMHAQQQRSHVGGGVVGGGDQQQHHYEPMVYESVPVVQGKAAAKRLRLFGVNMDCPINESDECRDHRLSSASVTTMPLFHHMSSSGTNGGSGGLMLAPPSSSFHSSNSPSPSSSSIPYLQLGPSSYNDHSDDDKGKGSMSLDLDI